MNDVTFELIKKAIKKDKNAIKQLIKKEQNNIYTTIFYLKKDEDEINDIMQNVLIKLTNKISQLRNPKNFKTWLNQIILNTYLDYLRKNKKTIKNSKIYIPIDDKITDLKDETNNPQDMILCSELDFVIKNSIESLPLHYKIPIALREIQGLTYDEISDVTKTSIGTVKSRIARARAIIKDDINKYSKD